MWRVYLQNSRDVGSTLLRARRVVKTGSGLISSAGAANIADGFLITPRAFQSISTVRILIQCT